MSGPETYRVRIDDARDVVVEVERTGADATVRVGDRRFAVALGPEGRVSVREADGGAHRVVTVEPTRTPAFVGLDGRAHAVAVMTAQQAALADVHAGGAQGLAARSLRSPMPGRIVRVLVAEGDDVAADTPAVIVEAMKMENEVRTLAAGKIVRVAVAAGDTVELGQLLCELEPHAAPP